MIILSYYHIAARGSLLAARCARRSLAVLRLLAARGLLAVLAVRCSLFALLAARCEFQIRLRSDYGDLLNEAKYCKKHPLSDC